MAEETWSGEIYCLKCKTKRQVSAAKVVVKDNGTRKTRMAQDTCSVCSTKLNRILGKA